MEQEYDLRLSRTETKWRSEMSGPIKLRDYQIDVDKAQREFMDNPDRFRAIVFACTGSGKTINFTKLIIDETLQRKSDGGAMKVMIAQPRLALSEEQQMRMHNILKDFDLTWEFIGFHTGRPVESQNRKCRFSRTATRTTSASTLADHKGTSKEDLHITWTTYNSLDKIRHLNYDLIICDEAHNLAYGEFHSNVKYFPERTKTIFYTATPVGIKDESDTDAHNKLGMLNENLFGKTIAEVLPRDLIELGYVVPPRIFFMAATTDMSNDPEKGIIDYAQLIGRAYGHQLTKVSPRFNHKMLVAMPGVYMFDDIIKNRHKISSEIGREVDVYSVHAKGQSVNGAVTPSSKRQKILRDFSENTGPAVILHCNTLAEGIDIDGIGGVLFLKKFVGKVKSLQTLGRACRPWRDDIESDGTVKGDRVKTHAIITLSEVDGKWESDTRVKEWSLLFSEGGYGKLWGYVDDEAPIVHETNTGSATQAEELAKKHITKARYKELINEELNQLRLDLGLSTSEKGIGNVSVQSS